MQVFVYTRMCPCVYICFCLFLEPVLSRGLSVKAKLLDIIYIYIQMHMYKTHKDRNIFYLCMYISIYIYIYIYICSFIRVCVCVFVCLVKRKNHINVYAHVYMCIYICMYIHIHTDIYIYIYIHLFIYGCALCVLRPPPSPLLPPNNGMGLKYKDLSQAPARLCPALPCPPCAPHPSPRPPLIKRVIDNVYNDYVTSQYD